MNSVQEEKVVGEFRKIRTMDRNEVAIYVQNLYINKPLMPTVVFKAILLGVDARLMDLKEQTKNGFEVVMSEFKEDDYK